MVYCDQTASNRPLNSIEQYLKMTCFPLYGNTHTNTSITGAQSTAFVAEARQIVAEATNAKITGKASTDIVLFAGAGTTAAVELLIDCLGIKHAAAGDQRPVLFMGPYEHHSNILPWRESGCEIVTVPECPIHKTVDHQALQQLLLKPCYRSRFKMGTFSAASNVTGKVSNVNQIAAILHKHGALAFFDYATAIPYMSVDMNPSPSSADSADENVAKDAVFFSPHKIIGGVGTPGVLIIKKHLVNQANAPKRSGGGTVFYVTNKHHRFLSNRVERFEGGTPNVCGILRVGLAFLFKRQAEKKYRDIVNHHLDHNNDKEKHNNADSAIPASLQDYEYFTYKGVRDHLKELVPNLLLLDGDSNNDSAPHLPIFSFLIKCGTRFLHYNYVCAILNDLFGIQSRGGCQCAGPYSQRLLGLTESGENDDVPNAQNEAIEHALVHYKERAESLRPGYTRLSLPFKGLCSEEVKYVMDALVWVAKNGWALMCHYRCNHRTGEVSDSGHTVASSRLADSPPFDRLLHPFESGDTLADKGPL
jgi:selenocysteine lyase/cysteine desulfurase